MRALLAGGGTGGHVIPALAIANELRDRFHAEIMFVGTARGIETRLVPAAGFTLKQIDVGQLKNVSIATRLKTLFALPRALLAASEIVREFRPDVAIGVGGYASGPAMLAAALSSVPTVAFEPNLVPGFANRVVAPMISAAAVMFPETCHWFHRCVVTGIPVRREFFKIPPRADGTPPTLLLFGGSQGAHALNVALIEALPLLRQTVPGLCIIHQTGERDDKDAQAAYLHAGMTAEVSPFIHDMPGAFARADLVISRSGASTVAEIAAAGKAAIFVPFPRASDDHQRRNAEALSANHAAMLIPEPELTPQKLAETAAQLLNDPVRLHAMGMAAHKFARPDAAGEIARLAGKLAGAAISG
jgi:UDP-N-acetylglucosamine--N-acetylmuramyl-(pentapeptide) pyrophosphoryl-undecaprenol N-acetylglucosamine transferase